jgi:hypothetical protein
MQFDVLLLPLIFDMSPRNLAFPEPTFCEGIAAGTLKYQGKGAEPLSSADLQGGTLMNKDYYDDWADHLEADEKYAFREIEEWEKKNVTGGKPFQGLSTIMKELEKMSPQLSKNVSETVRVALATLRDYSRISVNDVAISDKVSQRCGSAMTSVNRNEAISVQILDGAARDCIAFNMKAASIEGGLTGALGMSGMLLDIPLLYGILFRLIHEVAICYGYSVDGPEEKLYMMKVLELGHMPDDTSRQGTITDLYTLHTAIRGGVSLNQIERSALARGMEALAERIGITYARRKISTILMIVGGITGAAMNYLLAKEVSEAAYNTYRKRFLMDRAMARRLGRV